MTLAETESIKGRLLNNRLLSSGWVRCYGPIVCLLLSAFPFSHTHAFLLISIGALLLVFRRPNEIPVITLFDVSIVIFWLSTLLSTIFAYDIATALSQMQLRTICTLLYLLLRISAVPPIQVALATGIGLSIHSIVTLWAFFEAYHRWLSLRFVSLVDYRAWVALTLHGERPGNYVTIYLIGIALSLFSLLQRGKSRIAALVCVTTFGIFLFCSVLTFSRSMYVCTLISLIACGSGLYRSARISSTSIAIITVFVLVFVALGLIWFRPILGAVRDTALAAGHLSQQRSAHGRLRIEQNALRLTSVAGLVGVGVGNYGFALRKYGLTSPYLLSGHPFNTVLEVGIEQGYLGLVSLLAMFIGAAIKIFNDQRCQRQTRILLGGVCSIFLYSLSQSFLVADIFTAIALASFCSITAYEYSPKLIRS